MIHFQCPSCGKGIKVGDAGAGKDGKCPACGAAVHVPDQPHQATRREERPSLEALVEGVCEHAEAHRQEGGWDYVTRMSREEIAEEVTDCRTVNEAIEKADTVARLWAGLDEPPADEGQPSHIHVPNAPATATPPPLNRNRGTADVPDDVSAPADQPTAEPSVEVSQAASPSLTGLIGTLRSFGSDVLRRLQGLDLKGRIVLAIVVVVAVSVPTLMFSFSRSSAYRNLPQSARDALNAVKKLEARTEIGINYRDYSTIVGEVWGDVKLFIDSPEGKSVTEFSDLLASAVSKYKLALDLWQGKLDDTFDDELGDIVLQECWRAAGQRVDAAEALASGDSIKSALSRAAILRNADLTYEISMKTVFVELMTAQDERQAIRHDVVSQSAQHRDNLTQCIERIEKKLKDVIAEDSQEP